MKQTILRIATETSRFILGATFIFSGFVKSVDPSGFALKIEEYLTAFHLSFFSFLSLPASFGLCAFELILGILLLLGIYPKWTSRLVLLLMGFMTILTLYLAIANPVADCGCFGDAIILTNWETFAKNIFLLAFSIFLFIHSHLVTPLFRGPYKKLIALIFSALFTFGLLLVSYLYDNVVDFRPYHIGANLVEKMTVPENEKPIEELIFIYEKEGQQKEFTAENYPWQDSSWHFVERITKVHKQGKSPEITDFHINHYLFNDEVNAIIDEVDITEEILQDPGYSFLVIAPSLTDIGEKEWVKLRDVADYAAQYGYPLYCLTASPQQDIIESKNRELSLSEFCGTDEKTLITIVRTYPGILLLKEGIIVGKWGRRLIPPKEVWNQSLEKLSFIQNNNLKNQQK